MASSVNKIILVGNLGRNPDIRFSPDGGKVASLSIATSEYWKDKASGERRDRTEWHRVVVFNDKLAEVCEKYLKKGSKVYLEGQLQTRKWTDKQGQEHYTTEVILSKYRGEITLLDSGINSDSQESVEHYPESKLNIKPLGPEGYPPLNDEVPF